DGTSSFEVPNVFTPNGDGINDVFRVKTNNIVEFSGKVYNRWGELLFEWVGDKDGWDGYTFAGEPVPEGTYFVILEGTGYDGEKYGPIKKAITLIR
ncbi:MAG: gliding motility-associated C-terminal domain-containing protein, partial [Bacteroidetes bacterium]